MRKSLPIAAAWMLGRFAFFILVMLGFGFMVASSLSYAELGDVHPFFLEKFPLQRPQLWLGALYLHVPASLFALPACLLLLSRTVMRKIPRVHRWLGRLTGLVLLLVVVPSGAYLAFFATGGAISTLGFLLTGSITAVAMVKSVQAARVRDFKTHRRYSAHVAGQLCVAVGSRILLVLSAMTTLDEVTVYLAALWGPIVLALLVVEGLYARGRIPKPKLNQDHPFQDQDFQDQASQGNASQDNASQDNVSQDNASQDNATQDNGDHHAPLDALIRLNPLR